jgi:hypothetical protein
MSRIHGGERGKRKEKGETGQAAPMDLIVIKNSKDANKIKEIALKRFKKYLLYFNKNICLD